MILMIGTSKTCKAETQYRLTISLNIIMRGIKGVSFDVKIGPFNRQ